MIYEKDYKERLKRDESEGDRLFFYYKKAAGPSQGVRHAERKAWQNRDRDRKLKQGFVSVTR